LVILGENTIYTDPDVAVNEAEPASFHKWVGIGNSHGILTGASNSGNNKNFIYSIVADLFNSYTDVASSY